MSGAVERLDVAVVGAGPYGLSVAAHLAPRGRVRVFGRPMQTWRELMPRDMLLRSDWDHTNLSAPDDRGTIGQWVRETGETKTEPIPLEMFLRYADWFAAKFVPDIDGSSIERISSQDGGFSLVTDDGRVAQARNVILAVGVTPFAFVPEVFRHLGPEHASVAVSTTAEDSRTGTRVIVVGGGQNALEAALGAHRAGAARVDVLVRSRVKWFAAHEPNSQRGRMPPWLYRTAYPIVGFGPPPLNRLVLHPRLFARLPEAVRERLRRRMLRSGGSPWLRDQLEGHVTFHEGASIARVQARGRTVDVELADGRTMEADHLILACGYRFDLSRISALTPELRSRVEQSPRTGWPVLTDGARTTCPGLYFAGYPTEGRFGPLVRFVEGTRFAAGLCASSVDLA
jgi:thioredoxin reductase